MGWECVFSSTCLAFTAGMNPTHSFTREAHLHQRSGLFFCCLEISLETTQRSQAVPCNVPLNISFILSHSGQMENPSFLHSQPSFERYDSSRYCQVLLLSQLRHLGLTRNLEQQPEIPPPTDENSVCHELIKKLFPNHSPNSCPFSS